ncbi:hypothetical protein PQX77_009228 [Marasmius sp. AFHP31]|nr:hypothetical protein PQX77_009228 [Marasmius sp. AFHP31]
MDYTNRGTRGHSSNRNRGRGAQPRGGREDRGGHGQHGRGRANTSRGSRTGGQPNFVPYVQPSFAPEAILDLHRTNESDFNFKFNQPGIQCVKFGDFDVKDSHLQAMSSVPGLMNSLQVLFLGDSDTGSGWLLTDIGVQSFLSHATNLVSLSLDACTKLTNETLIYALESCPRLEYLRITGHDKLKGKIDESVFQIMKERENLGANLKELVLYDQYISTSEAEFKDFSIARKDLIIGTGETLGDGMGANMLAALTGGASLTAWKDGKVVHEKTDMGFYGPGGYEIDFY